MQTLVRSGGTGLDVYVAGKQYRLGVGEQGKCARVVVWVVEFVLSGILAVGMSWSHIRRKVSGQYDTDELEG